MATLQSLDIEKRSASTAPAPNVRQSIEPVAKLIDVSKCIGCKACQVACMMWNDLRDEVGENVGVYDNPVDLTAQSWTVMRFNEIDRQDGGIEWLIRKDGCMHCEEPGCLKVCPAPGAIVKYANGIVDYISENCIGCGYCIAGCPFNIPRISPLDQKAYKCSLCSDRVAVGLEPACVKACPTGSIQFGLKDNMRHYGEQRVAELKERGFANAGLYDPPGVGGTHVMYVLPHADQPDLYSNLPKDPEISPTVRWWKSAFEPISLGLLGLTVVGWLLHFLAVGPNEPSEHADKPKSQGDPHE
jgi:formate dehydrogenase iron-sulfur subunit